MDKKRWLGVSTGVLGRVRVPGGVDKIQAVYDSKLPYEVTLTLTNIVEGGEGDGSPGSCQTCQIVLNEEDLFLMARTMREAYELARRTKQELNSD
jgi:hypothetical protein